MELNRPEAATFVMQGTAGVDRCFSARAQVPDGPAQLAHSTGVGAECDERAGHWWILAGVTDVDWHDGPPEWGMGRPFFDYFDGAPPIGRRSTVTERKSPWAL